MRKLAFEAWMSLTSCQSRCSLPATALHSRTARECEGLREPQWSVANVIISIDGFEELIDSASKFEA
jgi:hypothetical protein